jgi:hypothetical protein
VAQINRWGMRDTDYELAKPPGAVRIAVVEASRAAGLGVEQPDLFEAQLESRLNAAHATSKRRYEVLNFSIHGHLPVQRLMVLEERVFQFAPDIVLYLGGAREDSSTHIANMYRRGVPAPYPIIDDVIARAGLRREMSGERMAALLEPYRHELLAFVLDRFAEETRRHGATPVWVYLPLLDGVGREHVADMEKQRQIAREAGFVVLDLDEVYTGHRVKDLQLTSNDYTHPNGFGHGLVAEGLYEQLLAASARGDVDLGLASLAH